MAPRNALIRVRSLEDDHFREKKRRIPVNGGVKKRKVDAPVPPYPDMCMREDNNS